MKKSLTKLLIIAIICLVFNGLFIISSMNENPFSITEQVREELDEVETDNPGAGWYLLIVGGIAITTDAFLRFIKAIILGISLLILIVIVVSQTLARIIQIGKQKKWKNITSKVFTVISIILQVLFCLYILFVITRGFMVNKILLALVLVLNIISVVLFIIELRKMKKLNIDTGIKSVVIEEK